MITTKKSFKRCSLDQNRQNQKQSRHIRKSSNNMVKKKTNAVGSDKKTKPDTKRGNKKKVKSADKCRKAPGQKLNLRKKSQDQTRPTIKQKTTQSFKQHIRVMKSKKAEKEQKVDKEKHKAKEEGEYVKKKHLSMEGIVKTNKFNILKKHKTKMTNNSKQKSRFLDKSKLKRAGRKRKGRKSSLRSFSGEKNNKSKEKNKANLKKLSKAKSVKLLKIKRSVSKDKRQIKKITKKINKKINIIDKKVNYLYSNISQNPKKPKKQVKLKNNKKKTKGKIKITKGANVVTSISKQKIVKKPNPNVLQNEFIFSLKELTETHLFKLNQLFDNFNKNKNAENQNLESDNIKELIQITKMTIQEYHTKMQSATRIIENEKPSEKTDLKIENISYVNTHNESKKKQTPKKSSPLKLKNPEKKEEFCLFDKRNSLELQTPKLHSNKEKLYSERSKNSKREVFFSESWKMPNKAVLNKNSKNLIISNITKTKNSEENMRSFDRMKNSNVMSSNCDNSEFGLCKIKSEKSIEKITDPIPLIKKDKTPIPIDNEKTIKEKIPLLKKEEPLKPTTIKKDVITEKVDKITEEILNTIVDDLFEDYLYRLFFLPDKIIGIKTNYNYCRFYFDALLKSIESRLTRKPQRRSSPKPLHSFRTRHPHQTSFLLCNEFGRRIRKRKYKRPGDKLQSCFTC